jgi:hypothetical protein
MSSMQQVNKAWSKIVGKSVSWNGLEMVRLDHRSYPLLVAKNGSSKKNCLLLDSFFVLSNVLSFK